MWWLQITSSVDILSRIPFIPKYAIIELAVKHKLLAQLPYRYGAGHRSLSSHVGFCMSWMKIISLVLCNS